MIYRSLALLCFATSSLVISFRPFFLRASSNLLWNSFFLKVAILSTQNVDANYLADWCFYLCLAARNGSEWPGQPGSEDQRERREGATREIR
mmetsp:Transcript_69001/g.143882  ORF Transcript_69001/g.143882 Transcript_69001/m.143882 type:complete len:92 (-) Transcript_69001:14-289(-)